MSVDRVSYTLDSTLETVNNAEETASRMAAEAGFDDEEIMKISMAVREAAVNAVLHGNAYAPENLMKTSGRGIFLIRSFMDVVEIHPSQTGTELRMIKHVHGNVDSKEAPRSEEHTSELQ